MAGDYASLREDYLVAPMGDAFDLVPEFFRRGYAVRIGPPEETLPVTLRLLPNVVAPTDHEEVVVLGRMVSNSDTQAGGRPPWTDVLRAAGREYRQLAHMGCAPGSVIGGQLRGRATHEPIAGRVYVTKDGNGTVDVATVCRWVGIDPESVEFVADPDLPDH